MSINLSSLRQDLDCNGMNPLDLDQTIADMEFSMDMLMTGNNPAEMIDLDSMSLAEFME